MTPRYRALALQTECHAINDCADTPSARSAIRAAIDRIHAETIASKQVAGPDVRSSCSRSTSSVDLRRMSRCRSGPSAAFDPNGVEYERIAQIAVDADVYLAVNSYETDEHFPGVYFQACVLFGPDGAARYRYRRLNSMWSVTPHDVLDRYLEVYGEDSLFPVADTEIGRIAPIASEEILYPEIARCFAVRGAEIFAHSSSEVASALMTPKNIAKRARALENNAYVVSREHGGGARHGAAARVWRREQPSRRLPRQPVGRGGARPVYGGQRGA